MVEHLLAVYTKEVCLELKFTSKVSNPYKTLSTCKIYVLNLEITNVLQVVKVVGRRKMQARHQKGKTPYTK